PLSPCPTPFRSDGPATCGTLHRASSSRVGQRPVPSVRPLLSGPDERCLPLGGDPLLETGSGHDTVKAVHLRSSDKVHGFGGAELLERWDVSDPHGPSVPAVLKWSADRLGDPDRKSVV